MIATETEELTQDELALAYSRYINDWSAFITEQLGLELWSGMRLIIDSVQNNMRTSVRAFHGSSKTICAAAIAITFLNLFSSAIVITTAPSHRQVNDLLWKEIRSIYKKNPQLLGQTKEVAMRIDIDKDSFMTGFSTDKATRIEGYHAPYILWVLDEAKGLPQWVYDAIEGSLTGGFVRVLEISTTNGVDQQCPFRKHHTSERSQWNSIHLAAFDSPFVDPGEYQEYANQKNPLLYDFGKSKNEKEWPSKWERMIQVSGKTWIDDKIKNWEKDRPDMWETKVEGNFWEQGSDNIIPLKWIESAINAVIEEEKKPEDLVKGKPGSLIERMRSAKSINIEKLLELDVAKRKVEINEETRAVLRKAKEKKDEIVQFGADIARMGDDQNVLTRLFKKIVTQKTWVKKRTTETAGIILRIIKDFADENQLIIAKDIRIKIDHIGVGAGVFDILCEKKMPAIGIESAGKAYESDKYVNLRAEIWFNARDIFERQFREGNVISIPNDPELIEDVSGMKYLAKLDGRYQVEAKEEFKKRIGRSPDKGDSLIYCLAHFDYSPEQDQYFSEEQVSEDGVYL